jgi:hypothetical protein
MSLKRLTIGDGKSPRRTKRNLWVVTPIPHRAEWTGCFTDVACRCFGWDQDVERLRNSPAGLMSCKRLRPTRFPVFGRDIGMTEDVLEGADVGVGIEEVRCETVPEGVAGDSLGDGSFFEGFFELPLQGVYEEVIPGEFPGAGMGAEFGGREEKGPRELAGGIRIFTLEGAREVDGGAVVLELVLVLLSPNSSWTSGRLRMVGGRWYSRGARGVWMMNSPCWKTARCRKTRALRVCFWVEGATFRSRTRWAERDRAAK